MRLLIQRVSHAKVEVENRTVGSIGTGALVFLGVTHADTIKESAYLAEKLLNLRMFHDEHQKMNRSLLDIQGSVLIVSQFTLYADCSEGRRPSFTQAAPPALAESIYRHFVEEVRKSGLVVATGIFGENMQVSLLNDGPVTLIVSSS